MDKRVQMYKFLRQCPELENLWCIAATEDIGNRVVLPQGASEARSYTDAFDTVGNYICDIVPYPSVFEDYQINCYEWYDVRDNSAPERNENVLSFEKAQQVCNWIAEQDEKQNFPDIGEKVVSIECRPFVPQIRYADPDTNTIAYFITVRLRYVNRAKGRSITYALE